jgi:hypothetical protein
MPDERRAKIVTEKDATGGLRVRVIDPRTGQEAGPAMQVPAGQAEQTVEQLKQTLERGGAQVDVVERT